MLDSKNVVWASPPRMKPDTKEMVIELSILMGRKDNPLSYVDVVHAALDSKLKRERKKHGG